MYIDNYKQLTRLAIQGTNIMRLSVAICEKLVYTWRDKVYANIFKLLVHFFVSFNFKIVLISAELGGNNIHFSFSSYATENDIVVCMKTANKKNLTM